MEKNFDLAWVDVETTGLDPDYHDIIELAIIRMDPVSLQEKGRFHQYYHPREPEDVSEEIRNLNGYDEKLWNERGAKDCIYLNLDNDDYEKISTILEGTAFAGQNPHFDKLFIETIFFDPKIGSLPFKMDYHVIDVANLVWPFVVAGLLPGMSLKHSRKFFGLTGEQTHTALQDVLDTIHVYKKVMDLYLSAAHLYRSNT